MENKNFYYVIVFRSILLIKAKIEFFKCALKSDFNYVKKMHISLEHIFRLLRKFFGFFKIL